MRRAAVANKSQTSKALKVVKELDAFPKIPDNYKETSASGGGVSLVTFILIGILVISEINYYTSTHLKFDYEVDTEVDGKIKINIDMTIAMRCEYIGADALDQTGQDTSTFGELAMDNTHYALSPKQEAYRDITRQVNQYMRDEYHAIQELMWLSGYNPSAKIGLPNRDDTPDTPPDACRVHGNLEVNKVAGNFHITAGKSLKLSTGHLHITSMLDAKDYNFTHRIDHFSFGDMTGGIINPLDGEEQTTTHNYHLFQYFMKVVPTKVRTYINNEDTFQYSVTERNRPINHNSGSHGVPGIFMKYDLFSFKVVVKEEHRPYSQFLVRMCGIVGGIFVVSGLLHNGMACLVDVLCCRYKWGKYDPAHKPDREPLLEQSNGSGEPAQGRPASLYDNAEYNQTFNPVHLAEQNISPEQHSNSINSSVENR